MKASELMIGDLVIFEDKIHKITDLSLCIDGSVLVCVDGHDCPIFYHEISAVTLTEEMLKANGWKKNEFSSAYIHHGVPFRLDIDIFCLWLDIEWDDYYNAFSFKYVHELQNALRLCGLNDLADNFKVND